MGITKDPPEFNSETIPYEQYKLELDAWTSVTDVPKEKWGKYVALSLPAKDPSDIRNKVFNGLMKDGKLAGDAGYQNLVTYLDGEFGTDEIVGVFNVFEAFDTHKKEEGMTIKQFVSGFELKYKAAKNKGFPELPQEYLMYKVIKGASLADWEEKMVHTDIDYTKKDELFKNAKAGLLKYFGSEKQKAQNKPSTAEDKAFMLNEGKEEEAFYGQATSAACRVSVRVAPASRSGRGVVCSVVPFCPRCRKNYPAPRCFFSQSSYIFKSRQWRDTTFVLLLASFT